MCASTVQDAEGAGRWRKPPRREGVPRSKTMNRIIWLVGLVVIVLFIAGYLGLR
jgi:hypothetical protein